jgi:transcriptional regulator with XRE-family HTH domain
MESRKETMSSNTPNPLHDPEVRRAYEEELLVAEATETICALVDELGITQRELAERLQLSEGRISQILSGGRNLTLRSLAGLGWALGVKFDLSPSAMSAEERVGTPAINDSAPPSWLKPTTMAEVRWVPRPNMSGGTHRRKNLPRTVGVTTSTVRSRERSFAY